MIWITQWLCPQRHCSIGFLWDETVNTAEEIEEQGEALYQDGTINRWCGICGSRDLKPEHGRTRFRTMEEAMPPFREAQQLNELTRLIIGDPTHVDPAQFPYPNLLEDS